MRAAMYAQHHYAYDDGSYDHEAHCPHQYVKELPYAVAYVVAERGWGVEQTVLCGEVCASGGIRTVDTGNGNYQRRGKKDNDVVNS